MHCYIRTRKCLEVANHHANAFSQLESAMSTHVNAVRDHLSQHLSTSLSFDMGSLA